MKQHLFDILKAAAAAAAVSFVSAILQQLGVAVPEAMKLLAQVASGFGLIKATSTMP